MGQLISKNGSRLKKRKLKPWEKKKKKRRRRNCFLQGPCMLCFIVSSGEEEEERLEGIAECCEDCAHFLLSPRQLAVWEGQGKNLLSAVPTRLIGPQLLFPHYPEMVCKRKCSELQRSAPCKQPRCAFKEAPGTDGANDASTGTVTHCQLPLCPLPSSSSSFSTSEACLGEGLSVEAGQGSGITSVTSQSSPSPCDCKCVEGTDVPDINHLPSSILLKVFSHLSLKERCLCASLVCKYWHDLCLDLQFWKQIDFSGLQKVTDDLLVKIASRRQNVTEINISDCRKVQDFGVSTLAAHCPGLLAYIAYRCKQLSDDSLAAVANHCPLLQKVHVGNQDKLTDQVLRKLGESCHEIRDIHLGQCYSISDEGMVALAKGCPKLQKLYMQENKQVTDKSVQAFAEHCPELRFVGFMGCSVTSQGVIHLTQLKNLSNLDLRHISELNNETVMEVVRKCPNLSSLNLCLNWSINDRCVEIIAKEGRSLKELYLVSCKITDHALIAIGQYSTTIETVDAGWCKEITDMGATQIAQSSKSLRYLGLMRCDKVNEETVETLVQQYPHIVFSTVMQDCKRTLERAYQMGWNPNSSSSS